MDILLLLVGFWLTHLAAVVSPGPSFIVVTRAAVGGSTRNGIAVALGLTIGTFLWAAAAWFGLATLFALVPTIYTVAKLAGAAFLLYIAFQLWRHAAEPFAIDVVETRQDGLAEAIRLGVMTQVANPKVAVFFGSVFAAILPPEPAPFVLFVVFAIVCVNEFVWYALVALVLSRSAVRRTYVRAKPFVDRLTSGVLALLGARLLVE